MRWGGLLALGWASGCGDEGSGGGQGTGLITSATSLGGSTGAPTGGGEGTGSSSGEVVGGSSSGGTGGGDATTGGGLTTAATTGGEDPGSTGDASTGAASEYFMFTDPLIGGTQGTAVGGSFGDTGWTVTGVADRVYWSMPRLVEGSVEFTMTNVTLDNLPLADHEVFAMYEGGHGIEHPIGYNPEYRNNTFKSMIRIYGVAEPERTGQQKIMWGMCPIGAPGYLEAECPCANPVGFFEEPFGGNGDWNGSPETLRVAWGDGVTRYFRNDVEVLTIDWAGSGFQFGPQELYVSLGNPRPEEVGSAGMPIGAVFSNLVVEGWTGPETPTCG
jgi:hypothetical protein